MNVAPFGVAQRGRLEQRVIDGLLAASALHWAIQTATSPGGLSLVGLTMVGLDLTAAGLFALRRPPVTEAPLRDMVPCLGSVILGGITLRLAPAYAGWPLGLAVLFAVAGLGAIASLVSLGRSFAVLPSRRALVKTGPYRFVRHPVYLAETTMLLAAAAAAATLVAVLVTLGAIALVVLRIRAEERLWADTTDHAEYVDRIRWRLVPGVW